MPGKIPLFFSPPWCYDRKPDVIKNKEGIVLMEKEQSGKTLFRGELADITKVPYPRIKIGFDVTCLAITAGMTFFFLGRLEGLGIGTIAAAFTMGKGIGLVGDLLDKHFYFENYKTLRTAKNKQ